MGKALKNAKKQVVQISERKKNFRPKKKNNNKYSGPGVGTCLVYVKTTKRSRWQERRRTVGEEGSEGYVWSVYPCVRNRIHVQIV